MTFDPSAYLDDDSPITPPVGLVLWYAADALTERADLDPSTAVAGLPRSAKTWADDPTWVTQLIECYRMVTARLAAGAFPIARCTGEEFALHIVVAAAAGLHEQGMGPDPTDHGMQLMPDPDVDELAEAHHRLFEDQDILMLFEPLLDGIEDAESSDNQRRFIGPYLHPSRWFDTFPGYDQADPLERIETVQSVDDDVIHAAVALALSVGARGTVTVDPDGGRWMARARYPGRELVGEGEDPQSAATALARLILDGARCPGCGRSVITDPGVVGDICRWERRGRQWQAGCT